MKKTIISFALILLLASSTYMQQSQLTQEAIRTERRVALVIGNSAYENAPLKNPVNDAQDMTQALRGLGFDVTFGENLNQNEMKRAIRAFGEKLRSDGGVGLFYYAGHGVQVKGVNYLIPVDTKVESEEEVEYEAVDAGFVLAQMESANNRLNIVILDACRNNPFARSFRSASRGLAKMDAPSGTLIAYATAPNSVANDGNARNGIYTQELLKFMRTPNLSVEEVFKGVRIAVRSLTQNRQTPWEESSLVGDFYFVKITEEAKGIAITPTPSPEQKVTSQSATPSNTAKVPTRDISFNLLDVNGACIPGQIVLSNKITGKEYFSFSDCKRVKFSKVEFGSYSIAQYGFKAEIEINSPTNSGRKIEMQLYKWPESEWQRWDAEFKRRGIPEH